MPIPLVSVVVPCYNEARTIRDSLLSILNQNIRKAEIEIFVIDGMSSDGTRYTLENMKREIDGFTIIDNLSGKTPVARNLGVKEAIGKYIAILDAHTIYQTDYLSNCISLLEEKKDIVCTGCPYISIGESSFGKATALAMSHPFGIGNARHRYPDYEGYAEGAAFPVYRREVFDEVGMFDENLIRNQDDEFNFRLKQKGMKVYITPKNSCLYHVRETPVKLFKQYFEYGFWRVAVILKHKIPISLRQVIPVLFVTGLLFSIISAFFLHGNNLFFSVIIPLVYFISLLVISIPIFFKNGFRIALFFICSISILHISYGTGFLVGVFSKKTRIKH
ncbi:MAG: glycosyltransferase family 2 protein [Ignavibacteriales bacterium]|nr:MAG: glycosyltransferase family 2 protein [Ignavibacteriales bacterium]